LDKIFVTTYSSKVGPLSTQQSAHVRTYEQLYTRVYRHMYARLQPLYRDIQAIAGYPAKN
jgi:hypothetical protein